MLSYFFSNSRRKNSVSSVNSIDTAPLSDTSDLNYSPRNSEFLTHQEIIDIHLDTLKNETLVHHSHALQHLQHIAKDADAETRGAIIKEILHGLKKTTMDDLAVIKQPRFATQFFKDCCSTLSNLLKPQDPVYLRVEVIIMLLRCTYKGADALKKIEEPILLSTGVYNMHGNRDDELPTPLFIRLKNSGEKSPYVGSIDRTSCKKLAQLIQATDPQSLRHLIIRGLAIDNGYGFGGPYSIAAGTALVNICKKHATLHNDVKNIFTNNPHNDHRKFSGKSFIENMYKHYPSEEDTANVSYGYSERYSSLN